MSLTLVNNLGQYILYPSSQHLGYSLFNEKGPSLPQTHPLRTPSQHLGDNFVYGSY